MNRTLLRRLNALCNVDIDDTDSEFIAKLPFKPCNQTSNQVVLAEVLNAPHNHAALSNVSGSMATKAGKKSGTECFATYFEECGISQDRYAIKVPFSGVGATASLVLSKERVRTLATAVFCLEQAIAASQARCLLISPYFQEIAAHTEESLRPKVDDIALEHPFSPRIIQMLELFTKLYQETRKEQPVMVIASHFDSPELLAMAELGCPHVTIQKARMIDLMNAPDDLSPVIKPKPLHPYARPRTSERLKKLASIDPIKPKDCDGILASTEVDYLVNSGKALDAAIDQDSVARKRMVDAMNRFKDAEKKAEAIITEEMRKLG